MSTPTPDKDTVLARYEEGIARRKQAVANLVDSSEAVDRARDTLAAVEADHTAAVQRALGTGLTERELRDIGVPLPAKSTRPNGRSPAARRTRPRSPRPTISTTPAPEAQASA